MREPGADPRDQERAGSEAQRAAIELLGEIEPEAARRTLERCVLGAISPAIAAMQLLLGGAPEAIERAIEGMVRRSSVEAGEPLAEARRLLRESRARCAPIAERLRRLPPPPESIDEAIDAQRRLFDWSVEQSEEASVALYSLGDPELLRRATAEVVTVLDGLCVLGRGRSALEIGSGIGRMQAALADTLADVHGVDVSPLMVAAARRRCAELRNVFFIQSSGRDLAPFSDRRFDLVFAVDTFPYLHQAGPALLEVYFHEIARVLRLHGDLVIFNFAYTLDRAAERAEVAALAAAFGFEVIVAGTSPFELWDGAAYHLRHVGVS